MFLVLKKTILGKHVVKRGFVYLTDMAGNTVATFKINGDSLVASPGGVIENLRKEGSYSHF